MSESCCCPCEISPNTTDPCLQGPDGRKYWCFLLSSICTFLAGLAVVLTWRAFAFLCCRKEADLPPNDPKQKEQKAARGKQEFEGTFMTEAKDWAGELISGQTTTGRILVSPKASAPCTRCNLRDAHTLFSTLCFELRLLFSPLDLVISWCWV